MRSIPRATIITLTTDECTVLEVMARSTKSEVRMRTRVQIVLAAADGLPSREIGRLIGCITGTVSKWRVRYTRHRFAGLDETGNRDAAAKYGGRILAMLDQPPPAGHGNWTTPLLARALGYKPRATLPPDQGAFSRPKPPPLTFLCQHSSRGL